MKAPPIMVRTEMKVTKIKIVSWLKQTPANFAAAVFDWVDRMAFSTFSCSLRAAASFVACRSSRSKIMILPADKSMVKSKGLEVELVATEGSERRTRLKPLKLEAVLPLHRGG